MRSEMQCKTPAEAIESLAIYTREQYAGNLSDAMESIGGIRYVRRAIALLEQDVEDHYAVMNPRLYNL